MSYEQQHNADWDRAADRYARAVKGYTDKMFVEYLPVVTYERDGVASALNVPARRVTVNLVAGPGLAAEQVDVTYGQPNYAANQIVNKRVRVWQRVTFIRGAHGPSVQSVLYFLDTVMGGQ
jgi:hypothetical protein